MRLNFVNVPLRSHICRDGCDLDAALQTYLMAYRNSIHSTTGTSPARLLQRRSLYSRLDLLKGDRQIEQRVLDAQQRQIDRGEGVRREFRVGDTVWARVFTDGNKWVEGRVLDKVGSRNYVIGTGSDPPIKRHVDQVRSRWLNTLPTTESAIPIQVHGSVEPSSAAGPSRNSSNLSNSAQPVNPPMPPPQLRPRENLRPPARYADS